MKKTALSIVLGLAVTLSSAVHASVLDFNFNSFASGTAVTTQVEGVAFSLIGGPGPTTAPTAGNSTGGFRLLTNSVTAGGYPTANILQVTFANLVSDLSFDFYNAGWGSSASRGQSFFSAFDSFGSLLETGSLFASQSGVTNFALASGGVKTLQFNNSTNGTQSWWFGLAGVRATEDAVSPVPEPETYAMLLAGLGLMAGIARRRKKQLAA
jgi:hypothetical protein